MDDFIDKIAWGLNIVFSNGYGYPRTRWLVLDGAQRRAGVQGLPAPHQVPTRVWYSAYGHLTAREHRATTRGSAPGCTATLDATRTRGRGCRRCERRRARAARHPGARRPRLRRAARPRAFLLLVDRRPRPRRGAGSAGSPTRDARRRARPATGAVNVAFTSARPARGSGSTARRCAQFSRRVRRRHDHAAPAAGSSATSGADAPERWDWGGPAAPAVDAAAAALRARRRRELDALEREQARGARPRGRASSRRSDTSDLDGYEQFGFRDGISQPIVEGLSKAGAGRDDRARRRVRPRLPERVRPLHRPAAPRASADPHGILPADPQRHRPRRPRPQRHVPRAPPAAARTSAASGASSTRRRGAPTAIADPARRARLAAKMVGRWPSGAPLVLAPDADDPRSPRRTTSPTTTPTRAARAARSARTSAARTRATRSTRPRARARPSTSTAGTGSCAAAASTARRCRSTEALRDGGDWRRERGLHFICLNANIARQFEFVQHTWLNNPKFAGLYDDADPLVGAVGAARRDVHRCQADGVRRALHRTCRSSSRCAAAPTSSCPGIARAPLPGDAMRRRAAGNVSSPVGSTCSTSFIDWRSCASSQYIRWRARLWFPSGRCSGMLCHGL